MAIYLSASSIADFIKCPQRVLYRITKPFPFVMSPEMIRGEIIHKVLEKRWKDSTSAYKFLEELWSKSTLNKKDLEDMTFLLDMFFINFQEYLTDEDSVEFNFKIPYNSDVFIVGKIDRISKGRIFDWKTGKVSKYTESDVQCMIYKYAYTAIFNGPPKEVNLVSLSEGTLYPYREHSFYTKEIFERVIPRMIKTIKESSYERLGLFNHGCYRCSYREGCLAEVNNVVDSSESFI